MNRRARAWVERYRTADKLGPGAIERMRAELEAKLAGGQAPLPGIDAEPPVLPKLSLTEKFVTHLGGKAILGVTALATVAGIGTLARQNAGDEPAARAPISTPVAPPSSKPEAIEPTSDLAGRASRELETDVRPLSIERPARVPRRRVSQNQAAPAADVEPRGASKAVEEEAPPREPAPALLDAEFGLLQRSYAALNSNKPAEALRLLEEHSDRFPQGRLQEAREVTRMLALCALGREREALARKQQFVVAHPQSVFIGRVKQICLARKPRP